MLLRPGSILLVGLLLLAAPLEGQRTTAHGRATITIPDLLSFEVVEESVGGGVETVVLVRANRDWRLVLRGGGAERAVEGGAGRDHRHVLDPALAAARRDGGLEITLSPN